MSKIHIKMLTDDALNFMKNNTATVAEKVKENPTNEWIYYILSSRRKCLKKKSLRLMTFH